MRNYLLQISCISAALLLLGATPANAQTTFKLNDTGQIKCYVWDDKTKTGNLTVCDTASTGDAATYPRQDGRFGRDAQAAKKQLTKIGDGPAGFDFTPLDANGSPLGTTGIHACVRDNVTGLIWSRETLSNKMNWNNAMLAANNYSRCGFNDGWRLPTRRELMSIVDRGRNSPVIDATYFQIPSISKGKEFEFMYWSSDQHATSSINAWLVSFSYGDVQYFGKIYEYYVRLVHGK